MISLFFPTAAYPRISGVTPVRQNRVAGPRAAVLLLAVWIAGTGSPASGQTGLEDLFPDPVIARGEGVLVRRGDLERAFIAYQSNLAARGQRLSELERPIREAQLLDRLIVTQLLVNQTTQGDREMARKLAAKNLAASKEMTPSDEMFARRLKTLGLTVSQYNLQIMEFSLAQAVLERELGSTVAISDKQIDDFYDNGTDLAVRKLSERLAKLAADPDATGNQLKQLKDRIEAIRRSNLDWFNKPEKRRIRHILLATIDKNTQKRLSETEIAAKRRQIERILPIAKAGGDFVELVELYSEEEGIKETKGEAVLLRKNRLPRLEAAAFSLKLNQISDIVESILGFHIVKLEEIIPAVRVAREVAEPRIRELLVDQHLQELMPPYIESLKKAANITILDDKYKLLIPEDAEPVKPDEIIVPKSAASNRADLSRPR